MTTQFLVTLRKGVNVNHVRNIMDIQKRNLSFNEIVAKQNKIFNQEQKRQKNDVGRVEKIEVRYLGSPKDLTLQMNRNISTPYNIAQHISEGKCKSSVVALLDNKKLWDMHRPIPDACTVQLLHFKINDPSEVNKIFWRSCSFLLGAVFKRTFKEDVGLLLHSFPPAIVQSGSYAHDVALNESNWEPSKDDLHALSVEMGKLALNNTKIERLEVSHEIAMDIFSENPFKTEQLPSISNKHKGKVTVYRAGDHIDISVGPMMSSTHFIGITKIVAAHKISNSNDTSNLYRIQGISLPTGFTVSAFAFTNVLVPRAKQLNKTGLGYYKDESSDQPRQIDETLLKQQIAN